MMNSILFEDYFRLTPYPIENRAHWQKLRNDPRHTALFETMEALIAPTLPL